MALILYNNTDFAQAAVRETKGWKIGGNKIKVVGTFGCCKEFSREIQQHAFLNQMNITRSFFLTRLISLVRKVKWLSIVLCSHQDRTSVTSMRFQQRGGMFFILC